MLSYYELLGVSNNATSRDIERSARKLVKHLHPDRVGTNDTSYLFDEVTKARNTLCDDSKRQSYDDHLSRIADDYANDNTGITGKSFTSFEMSYAFETMKKMQTDFINVHNRAMTRMFPRDGMGEISLPAGVMAIGGTYEYEHFNVTVNPRTKVGETVVVEGKDGSRDVVRARPSGPTGNQWLYDGMVAGMYPVDYDSLLSGGEVTVDVFGVGLRDIVIEPTNGLYTVVHNDSVLAVFYVKELKEFD